jgi:uncharacterized protein (DUF2147 family)
VFQKLTSAGIALATVAFSTLAAEASPVGVWLDHTGRGAVEISDCNGSLCGKVVWLREAGHGKACGLQVIGDARAMAGGSWDGGWIYDPEKKARYSVELTPIDANSLKVMGYKGSKFLSRTMTWTRAPADLVRCDTSTTANAPSAGSPAPAPAAAAAPAPLPGSIAQPGRATEPAPLPTARASEPASAPPTRKSGTGGGQGLARDCLLKAPYVEIRIPCPG